MSAKCQKQTLEHSSRTPAFIAGLSATCAGGTALASQTNLVWHSASYPDPSFTTALELTSQLDHQFGAGHVIKASALSR